MKYFVLILAVFAGLPTWALGLSELLDTVEKQNYELSAQSSEVLALSKEKGIAATPGMPMVGLRRETMIMDAEYVMLTQSLRFPLKYLYESRLAGQKHEIAKLELEVLKLQKRAAAKSLYFEGYANKKTIELLEATKRTLREYARVAESKYASGAALQNEAMDVHLLVTLAETELLEAQATEQVLMAQLRALLGSAKVEKINYDLNLAIPRLEAMSPELLNWVENSPEYKIVANIEEASEQEKTLASLEFAPDFELSYGKSIGGEVEEGQMLQIGMSIPLWFWKPSLQSSQASARLQKANALRLNKELELRSQIQALIAEVQTQEKLLKITTTSLIPQAETSLRIAGANYRSGKGSFGALRDAERAYYEVQKQYYSKLEKYTKKLASLEALVGKDLAQW